jgi:MOSC domain-containing protein
MWIAELWRYPVKSMAGEPLERTELLPDGIEGDRLVQVFDARGRLITARTHPRLLGHRSTLGPDGEPLVDGRPWRSPEVAREVEEIVGPGARLIANRGEERFDVRPLLVATDGAIQAFGRDRRRLRPNVVIGGVPGLAERDWQLYNLRAGETVIGLKKLRSRCIMTTYDPDTQEQDVEVLYGIQRQFGGVLALNAIVLQGGPLAVGDPVELLAERNG